MDEEKPNSGIREFYSKLKEFYDKQYKRLLIIPFLLLLLAIIAIAYQYATTGDFINRDVSLKGGITITIPLQEETNLLELKQFLSSQFPKNDMLVRSLKKTGKQVGIIINSDIDGTKKSEVDALMDSIRKKLNRPLTEGEYSIEFVGSSLGASFFKEAIKAVYIAFLFMGAVVFLYFGTKTYQKAISLMLSVTAAFLIFVLKNPTADIIAYAIGIISVFLYIKYSIPSIAVVLAAFSDIVITLAAVNLLGIKISTAGIAAFLMLIGYSVDTDILLSTRVLKRKEGLLIDKIVWALQTGLMMTITTLVAAIISFIMTQSEVIKQIMVILIIGLIADIINTWIQNVGILRIYIENTEKKMAKV